MTVRQNAVGYAGTPSETITPDGSKQITDKHIYNSLREDIALSAQVTITAPINSGWGMFKGCIGKDNLFKFAV